MIITHRKYFDIIGIPLDFGGNTSEITRLNMIADNRIVISKENFLLSSIENGLILFSNDLRRVNFSPLSGARRNPIMVKQLIRKHGTRNQMNVSRYE